MPACGVETFQQSSGNRSTFRNVYSVVYLSRRLVLLQLQESAHVPQTRRPSKVPGFNYVLQVISRFKSTILLPETRIPKDPAAELYGRNSLDEQLPGFLVLRFGGSR